jgi:calcium-dependent protein kinase
MRQILSALSYLHEANFVLRDRKTENIMFARSVQSGCVGNIKLIDFGLCCPFERGTKIAKAAGTPYSVAPELVTAPVQYDQRCDSWSAGVVMYIILSGQYPFRGKTKEELLNRIRRDPVSFKDKSW